MMNVYIPFNMIVDIDSGVIKLVELIQNIEPYSDNKLKSFLINRKEINPIPEYKQARGFYVLDSTYEIILDKYYKDALKLSIITDLIGLAINTYKLGMGKQVNVVIGCDEELEAEYLKSILKIDYKINICLNKDIKLKNFDCIFIKYIDDTYCDYLIQDEEISAKRIYVADYFFNTLYDSESKQKIIDPVLQLKMEEYGNILSLVSLYNKKRRK